MILMVRKTWVLDKAWAELINNWTQVSTQTIYQKKWVLLAISYNNCWAIWLQLLHILQKKMNYILIKRIVLLFQFPLWSPFPVKLFSFRGQRWLEILKLVVYNSSSILFCQYFGPFFVAVFAIFQTHCQSLAWPMVIGKCSQFSPVLLSMKERFFLTDWFWRNSLKESCGW